MDHVPYCIIMDINRIADVVTIVEQHVESILDLNLIWHHPVSYSSFLTLVFSASSIINYVGKHSLH